MNFLSGTCELCDQKIWVWNRCHWANTTGLGTFFRFMICKRCSREKNKKFSVRIMTKGKNTESEVIISPCDTLIFYEQFLSKIIRKKIKFNHSISLPPFPIIGYLYILFLYLRINQTSNIINNNLIGIVKYISVIHWKKKNKSKLDNHEKKFHDIFMKNTLINKILYNNIYMKTSFGTINNDVDKKSRIRRQIELCENSYITTHYNPTVF